MSYLPSGDFNTDFNRNSDKPLGPWGTADQDKCGITNGKCWDDSAQFSSADVGKLGRCMLDVFDQYTDA